MACCFFFLYPNINFCSSKNKYLLLSAKNNHGAVVNVLDCDIVISEFELQSRYYVYFRINTPEKGMIPFITPHQLCVK